MNDPEQIVVIRNFTDILDLLDIVYAIGGSLASSTYGRIRFTQDADITVEPFENKAERLCESLKPDFYISEEAMHRALRQRDSFNIIHFESAFKIDVFVRKDTAFEKELMLRRKLLKLSDCAEKSFSVISPEDIILLKLQWYGSGGRSSEQQWNDILGVLEVQAKKLDFEYLNKWAGILAVSDLLQKAVLEAE